MAGSPSGMASISVSRVRGHETGVIIIVPIARCNSILDKLCVVINQSPLGSSLSDLNVKSE